MTDKRGSIIGGANASGVSQYKNAYDEYGRGQTNSAGAPTNTGRFQYTGQMWLAEIGLYHYKARIYDPGLGRFLQTDPIGYGDGMNMYAYAGGDPVNRRDPSGMMDRGDSLLFGSCAGRCIDSGTGDLTGNYFPGGLAFGLFGGGGGGGGGPRGSYIPPTQDGYSWNGDTLSVFATRGYFSFEFSHLSFEPFGQTGSGRGAGIDKFERDMIAFARELRDRASDIYCALPSGGLSFGFGGYGPLGGGFAVDVAFDPQTGFLGGSIGLNVGVGYGVSGGISATTMRNVPQGWSGGIGANGNVRVGPVSIGGAYSLLGSSGAGGNGFSGRNAPSIHPFGGNLNFSARGGYGAQLLPSCN